MFGAAPVLTHKKSFPSACIPMGCLRLMTAIAIAAVLSGCPYDEEKSNQDETPKDPPRYLESGEKVTFQFPADGFYHKSPYLALKGQTLLIKADELSSGMVPGDAIRMKIERSEFVIGNERRMRISQPGPMKFRIESNSMRDWIENLTVEIERME